MRRLRALERSAVVRRETFGAPLAGMEIRIVDAETGLPVAPGDPGEIFVKGPTPMEGYYRVPREQTFTPDGFFKTGDLGYLDEQGYLHFASRLKDVIKTAGVNVAAVEVEEALAKHPVSEGGSRRRRSRSGPGRKRRRVRRPQRSRQGDSRRPPEVLPGNARERQGAAPPLRRHEADVPRTGTGKIAKPALREPRNDYSDGVRGGRGCRARRL